MINRVTIQTKTNYKWQQKLQAKLYMANCKIVVGKEEGAREAKNEHGSKGQLLALTVLITSLISFPSFHLSALSLKVSNSCH